MVVRESSTESKCPIFLLSILLSHNEQIRQPDDLEPQLGGEGDARFARHGFY